MVHWSGPDGFTSNLQNPVIQNATTVKSGWYKGTATLGNCISIQDSVWVTVNSGPNAYITGNNTVCIGNSTLLTGHGTGTYKWSTNETTTTISVSPNVSTTYNLVVTGSNGCTSIASFYVGVHPAPIVTVMPINPTICEGDSITLIASGAINFSWDNGAIGAVNIVAPTTTITYTVTGSNAPSCVDVKSINVVVKPKPFVDLNLSPNTICINTGEFPASGGYPQGGVYTGPLVFNGVIYPDKLQTPGTFPVTYTVESNGCISKTTKDIQINPVTPMWFHPIEPNPVDLNAPAFELNTGIPPGGIYKGQGVQEQNGYYYFDPFYANVGLKIITYTFKDSHGCEDVREQAITVVRGLGINEGYWKNTCVYPNPMSDNILTIEMDALKSGYVEIANLNGSILITKKIDGKKIGVDVSSLPSGLYFIRLCSESGKVQTMKIMKKWPRIHFLLIESSRRWAGYFFIL